jgi:hypothetical protein
VVEHPEKYDPSRLGIMAYLRMAARDDLINLLKRESRHTSRRAPIEAVELRRAVGNEPHETPDLPGGVSSEFIMRKLDEALPNPQDREAVRLMMDGVRETKIYARLYGITDLPLEDQQKQVKNHKDRLDKVMKRLGMRLRDGG